MKELLEWDGVWSEELIVLTLDVLAEIEADEMRRHQAAVSAAIAGAFQKGGADKFNRLLDEVKEESRAVRGGKAHEKKPGKSIAQEMLAIFGQMGMQVPRPKR